MNRRAFLRAALLSPVAAAAAPFNPDWQPGLVKIRNVGRSVVTLVAGRPGQRMTVLPGEAGLIVSWGPLTDDGTYRESYIGG